MTLRPAVALAFGASLAGLAATASAHDIGLSRGDYRVDGSTVAATLTFSATELALAVPVLERDDAPLSDARLASAHDAIVTTILDRVVVVGNGVRCPGTLDGAALAESGAVALSTRFTCEEPPTELGIDFAAVDVLASGHRHLGHVTAGDQVADFIAFAGNRTKHLRLGSVGFGGKSERGAFPLFRMGTEHILTGYDHLLFLGGLVLAPGRLRSLVFAITAFTVAHSLTLALATLGIWGPGPRFVEPIIALSIAYVGIENRFGKNFDQRWRITFPFGLIHGFGFASALRDLSIPRAELPLALFSFNAGVEVGQLLAMSAALGLLFLAKRRGVLGVPALRMMSAAVGVTGFLWFVVRVFGT